MRDAHFRQRIGLAEDLQRLLQRRHAFIRPLQDAQGNASLQKDLRAQPLVLHLALKPFGAIEQFQRRRRLATRVAHAGEPTQCVGLAADVRDLAAQRECGLERALRRIPVAQVLEHAAQVVFGDHLLARESRCAVCFQRHLVIFAPLRVVAEPVVERGDAVDRGLHLLRQIQLLENRAGVLQIRQAVGKLALHPAQIAALEQRLGQDLVFVPQLGNRHRLLELRHRLCVVAGNFGEVALAQQQGSHQARPLRSRHQCAGAVDFALCQNTIALRVVIA